MLQFFRKYQKFLFLFVTVIIICTFVFFGTYQAFAPTKGRLEGEDNPVTQMVRFLDTEAWMMSQKIFATNFLNDGVVSKEFLETGLGAIIAQKYPERFKEDFAACYAKEKQATPYVHPVIPTVSAEMVWSMMAPDMSEKYKALQKTGGFKERSELFLAQMQVPPAFFSQVIRYQEHNNPGAPRDPKLANDDIYLFGHQTLTDWFGNSYMESIASIIIQTAAQARKMGYKVSKQEVLNDLVARSSELFKHIKGKIDLPVADGYGLFQLSLRQNGMTEEMAIKIWEDVTLFRRLLHEVGDAALVDPLAVSQFYAYAYENANIELYQVPAEARLKSTADLEQFETYLAAVSNKESPLDIPQQYDSVQKIEERAPNLVGRHYTLYYAHTSKQALQSRVSIKETLDWEMDPQNWEKIQNHFPEIAQSTLGAFDTLEKMDAKARKLVDAFARKQIAAAHPEWIEEALLSDKMVEKELFLSSDPSQKTFEGIKDAAKLADVLNEKNEVIGYTQDKVHYYRFLIKQKDEEKTVLTFKEAAKAGILDSLSEKLDGKTLTKAVVQACPEGYRELAHAYRFAPFIVKHFAAAPTGPLAGQFKIEKCEKTITRCESSFIKIEDVLALEAGKYSQVKIDPAEGAYLFRFVDTHKDTTLPIQKMVQTQGILSKEARCKYFEKLLEHMTL